MINRRIDRNRLMKGIKKYSKENKRQNWIKEQRNIRNTFKQINRISNYKLIDEVLKVEKGKWIDQYKWIKHIHKCSLI